MQPFALTKPVFAHVKFFTHAICGLAASGLCSAIKARSRFKSSTACDVNLSFIISVVLFHPRYPNCRASRVPHRPR